MNEREISKSLPRIAKMIDVALEELAGERRGFLLLTFPLEQESGQCQYVSNVQREDTVKVLRRHLNLWERGMPDVPYDDVQ